MGQISLWMVVAASFLQFVAAVPKIDPLFLKSLNSGQKSTVIITPKESKSAPTDRSYADVVDQLSITAKAIQTRTERIHHVANILKEFTQNSQADIVEFLNAMKAAGRGDLDIAPLWIINRIIVRNVDAGLAKLLAQRPDIVKIEQDQMFSITDPEGESMSENTNSMAQWGVQSVQAPLVWNRSANNSRGDGVVVGVIDTGVRATHEALRDNFRSSFGWFDPDRRSLTPNDDHGHGTHVTGTIVGRTNGIGVAPGAQWIACRGCSKSGCSQAALCQCGQFMACPTDAFGLLRDCSKAPQVVNNSWGGRGGSVEYELILFIWRLVGIIPVFAAGNSGPLCATHGSPGDSYQVISSGSTDEDDKLSSFSSRGPAYIGLRIKPDVVAPGGKIVSASNKADNQYQTMSGTSMASPHVAGVVALMMAQNNKMTFDQVKETLTKTCGPINTNTPLPVPLFLKNCGGIPEETYPNNHAGYGKVNVARAVGKVN